MEKKLKLTRKNTNYDLFFGFPATTHTHTHTHTKWGVSWGWASVRI